ncbi:unnamed protein product [Mytilus coruscus]|uniref:Ig-like domain-containing protein n=1 Tax=Mytilus coruscus TaxID=42192 RepID=A0A6J8ALK5_MYTCO|nr:unnamed protein product [Mytilus coruscus]
MKQGQTWATHAFEIFPAMHVTVLAVNVDWQIKSPVSFGKNAYLTCNISDQNFNCTRHLRQWLGGENYGSLCYNNKCKASLEKYDVLQVETRCEYILEIERFSEHDVNCDYTCSYGIWRKRKKLTLDEMEFIYTPDQDDVIQEFKVTKNNTIQQKIKISKVYPMPTCFAALNSKNITDVMHISLHKVGIFFAVDLEINHHVLSCSGNLTVTCYIGNVEINITKLAFNNCKGRNRQSRFSVVILVGIMSPLIILLLVAVSLHRELPSCLGKNWNKASSGINDKGTAPTAIFVVFFY